MNPTEPTHTPHPFPSEGATQPPYHPMQPPVPITFSARHAKKIAVGIVIAIPVLVVSGIVLIMLNYHSNKTVDKNVPANTIPTNIGTKRVINHTIKTDLGYEITLDEVVTGFRAPYVPDTVDPYIIKVTIAETADVRYAGTSPYPSDFALIVDGKAASNVT